jgi:hypothetical protein
MANTTLTASIVAAEAVRILDNELVMATKVFRGYKEDFAMRPNGYKVGETISIRKPTDFTVRDTPVMAVQDVVEGKTSITVDQRRGVDFRFTSQELTLEIGELSDRVIKPAMVQLANRMDADLHALYAKVPNWVGTPGQTINSFADFAKAPERLDATSVPRDGRCGVLSPADHWGLVGSQTALFNNSINQASFRKGETGNIAGVDLYMTQNVATHTTGTFAGTTAVDASITSSTTTYAAVKDTMIASITVDGFTASAPALATGDVFTIDGVYDVNPVTKARLPHLKMFTVVAGVIGSGNEATFNYYPAMIWTGAFKNVDVVGVTNLNNQGVTWIGTQSSVYPQNMVFHPNAFALVSVPLESPPGAVDVGRQTYKGTSVRVIPVYDGVNDVSAWRLDVLYGLAAIDPRLAVRASGTA